MNKINLIIRVASKRDVPEMLELIRKYERYDEEYAQRYYDKYFAGDKAVWEDTASVAEIEGRVGSVVGPR
jgi:N-acetylglutamate synthase-like GNAT family acetyltransferase